MSDIYILAIEFAKRSFQVCATDCDGSVLYNRLMSRAKLELTDPAHVRGREQSGDRLRVPADRSGHLCHYCANPVPAGVRAEEPEGARQFGYPVPIRS